MRWLVAAALVALASACVRDKAAAPPEPQLKFDAKGSPLLFAFEAIDGKPLTSDSLRGRVTVIGFVTTYDFASQAETRFLGGIARSHVPRVNVAALVLEPEENRPLAEAFAHTLNVPFPVALADASTIAGNGPFAGLHHVPSVVVLDPLGREVYRHVGLIDQVKLEAVLKDIQAEVR